MTVQDQLKANQQVQFDQNMAMHTLMGNLQHWRKNQKNNAPMTLDYICLRTSSNRQEGPGFLHLQPIKTMSRKKITLVPTNEWCIKKVNSIMKH